MKIAFFSDAFWPMINGVATSVQEISTLLAERGHHILIVAPSPGHGNHLSDFKLHKNINVFWAPAIDIRIYPELRVGFLSLDLVRTVRKFKPDIIHTQAPFMVGFEGMVLAKQLGVPLVSTHHTNYTDEESLKSLNLYGSPIAIQIQKGAEKIISFFLNRHDYVIAPSQDALTDIKNMGVKKPIALIPSPIDISRLKKAKQHGQKMRNQLGIKKACMYVGRMSGEKNIDLIIKVFAKAREKIPELKLILVGDGNQRGKLFNLAAQLQVSESIVWAGKIPHQKLVDDGYYYWADVFVTLSRFETQGLSTLEAMACGLPVIGAKARATEELVTGTGIIVETDDLDAIAAQLVKLFKNGLLMLKLSTLSKKKAQAFHPDSIVNQILSVYKSVLKNKK